MCCVCKDLDRPNIYTRAAVLQSRSGRSVRQRGSGRSVRQWREQGAGLGLRAAGGRTSSETIIVQLG